MRYIISGGGTGGHVFPAIAIADGLKRIHADAEILFVGAKGKMEMIKVPASGYEIKGLWISGFQRKKIIANLLLPLKVMSSVWNAWKIIRHFKPDVAIGVGGYASAPTLYAAAKIGVPSIIQEQNSLAGKTNIFLSRFVERICVAYKHMERFFPPHKIVLTGNPVRKSLSQTEISKEAAKKQLGFISDIPLVLIVGGSLGARSINEAMKSNAAAISEKSNVNWFWQTGKLYYEDCNRSETASLSNVKVAAFIDDMAIAYAAADVVLCRAGALTITELCTLGKPSILVPSPNVAEDHQTKNAMALVQEQAALMIPDAQIKEHLTTAATNLIEDKDKRELFSTNAKALVPEDALGLILSEIINLQKRQAA